MAETFSVAFDDAEVVRALRELGENVDDMSDAAREISETLLFYVEDAFEAEGNTPWPLLAEATIEERTAEGSWPGKILQRTGQLAASYFSDFGPDFASVGSNKVYAAIHQFGGTAGRGGTSEIPARPVVPVNVQGEITNEYLREDVLDILSRFLVP